MRASIRTRKYKGLIGLTTAFILARAFVGPAAAVEPAVAKSRTKTPTPAPARDSVAAKQAYEEALRAFNLGHWQDAVAGFEKSYTLSGDAALLFNVAQAQRQAGNVKEAIIAYKAFLREKPDTPHRDMVEAKLKEMEAGAEAKTAVAKTADSNPSPDQLMGISEDRFAGRNILEPPPTAPVSAPAETVPAAATVVPAKPLSTPAPAEPSTPQALPAATPRAAASVVVSAPPIAQERIPVRDNALDLSQRPAFQEAAPRPGSRWWLWTGVGAVVVAAAVTAVILSTRGPERDVSCPSGVNGCLSVGK